MKIHKAVDYPTQRPYTTFDNAIGNVTAEKVFKIGDKVCN